MKNKYAGPCKYCGETVPAGVGEVTKNYRYEWEVSHVGACPVARINPRDVLTKNSPFTAWFCAEQVSASQWVQHVFYDLDEFDRIAKNTSLHLCRETEAHGCKIGKQEHDLRDDYPGYTEIESWDESGNITSNTPIQSQ